MSVFSHFLSKMGVMFFFFFFFSREDFEITLVFIMYDSS